jgi:hypothetical protein
MFNMYSLLRIFTPQIFELAWWAQFQWCRSKDFLQLGGLPVVVRACGIVKYFLCSFWCFVDQVFPDLP